MTTVINSMKSVFNWPGSASSRDRRPITLRHLLTLFGLMLFTTGIAQAQIFSSPSVDGQPVIIEVVMVMVDIDEISSADQSFVANFFYSVRWNDPRLAHDGTSAVIKPIDEVWNPNLQILNLQKIFKTMSEMVRIEPDGTVIYQQRVWGNFSQPFDLRYFPFDQQTIAIQLVSANEEGEDVVFVQDPARVSGLARKFSLADWDVRNWAIEPSQFELLKGSQVLPMITMSLTVTRQTGYYLMKFILPLIFIVAMSWIAFWIHPSESGTQFSVAVTSMLTLIAYRFAVDTLLPRVSYMTRMDFFIFFATFLMFLTLVEVVITAGLANRGQISLAEKVDCWARVVFPGVFVFSSLFAFNS